VRLPGNIVAPWAWAAGEVATMKPPVAATTAAMKAAKSWRLRFTLSPFRFGNSFQGSADACRVHNKSMCVHPLLAPAIEERLMKALPWQTCIKALLRDRLAVTAQ